MNDQLAKQVQASGTKISKEKLIEMIRRSPQREFSYVQPAGSKVAVISVPV